MNPTCSPIILGYGESPKERYCCPMAHWRKQNSRTQQIVPIDDQYHVWQKHERDRSEQLPDGWTYVQDDDSRGFVHKDAGLKGLESRYKHPVPIAQAAPIRPDFSVWNTSIHGTVRLASLRFDEARYGTLFQKWDLYTPSGEYAGRIWISDENKGPIVAKDECLVIAIMHTVVSVPNVGSKTVKDESEAKDHHTGAGSDGYVYVLWIDWEGDMAYRRGSGRIGYDVWKTLETKEIEIVLG
jgi:hypothetical protein